MILLRLIILFSLAWLGYRLLRRWLGVGTGSAQKNRTQPQKSSEEFMEKCAHCGVYVPASQALHNGSRSYCSAAHRDADRR